MLDALGPSLVGEVAADALRFASEKRWNTETCTACTVCANVCPTGALTPAALWRELRFDASRCVRCGLCHDACEPRALTLSPTVRLAALTERRANPPGAHGDARVRGVRRGVQAPRRRGALRAL
jgi:formate hydrogenlyase subunit 6/NADH:ubiquinone oxidoreductase subunit I